MYRQSVQAIAEMTECSRCGGPLDDHRAHRHKFCPKCATAYSTVPDYETLEREIILDALAGEDY